MQLAFTGVYLSTMGFSEADGIAVFAFAMSLSSLFFNIGLFRFEYQRVKESETGFFNMRDSDIHSPKPRQRGQAGGNTLTVHHCKWPACRHGDLMNGKEYCSELHLCMGAEVGCQQGMSSCSKTERERAFLFSALVPNGSRHRALGSRTCSVLLPRYARHL